MQQKPELEKERTGCLNAGNTCDNGSEGGEKCKSTAKEVNSQPELRQWATTLQREEAQLSKIPLASEPGSHPH